MLPLGFLEPLAAGGITLIAITVVVILIASIFWIVELVDAARRRFYDPNMKIVWILVIWFFHIIGALIYYFVGKSQGEL